MTPCKPGATPEEALRHVGWIEVQRRDGLTPCWEWNGLTTAKGYGRLYLGAERRTVRAHRLAYSLWVSPLGDSEHVCHRCDNPPCINPSHLFGGTPAVNSTDMVAKRRSCNGERRPQAKLTDKQVAAIRAAYIGVPGQQRELAAQYGISQTQVSVIVRGLSRVRSTNPEPD